MPVLQLRVFDQHCIADHGGVEVSNLYWNSYFADVNVWVNQAMLVRVMVVDV